MCDANTIVRERQLVVRREMDRRGISLKAVHLDSGISYSTIVSYFPGERDRQPAVVPVPVLYTLAETGALPLDLLSLLMPAGFQIVRLPEDIDHDEIAHAFRDYLGAKDAAHHPDSPGGREISSCERENLNGRVVALGIAA